MVGKEKLVRTTDQDTEQKKSSFLGCSNTTTLNLTAECSQSINEPAPIIYWYFLEEKKEVFT